MADQIQWVTLHLEDGTKAKFSGPAQIDADKPIGVTRIEVTDPKPLPEGCHWGSPE